MRGSRARRACRRKRRSGRVRRGAGLGAPASPSRACGHPALSRRTLRRVARTLAAKRAGEARSAIWERTRRRGGRSPHPRDAVGGSSTFELHRSVGRLAAAASEGVSPNLVAAVPMRPNPRVGAGVVVEIWSDRSSGSIRGVAHTRPRVLVRLVIRGDLFTASLGYLELTAKIRGGRKAGLFPPPSLD